MILSKKGREYIKACQGAVNTLYMQKISGDLSVKLFLYPPDGRQRDIDNYLKAVFDAMTHAGVWIDDIQVKQLYVEMRDKIKGGKAVIEINQI